jgi:hypothetical protein
MRINRLTLAVALALVCASSAAFLPGTSNARSSFAATTDCDGDACSSVTVTFDDSRQQYRAQNNSADRWAKVTASNLAASASACLGPGESEYLPLQSIVAPYHANFADTRCGAPQQPGYPPPGE